MHAACADAAEKLKAKIKAKINANRCGMEITTFTGAN
jgi:hypothetical protein